MCVFDANNISARGHLQAGYKITVTPSRHHLHTFENRNVIRNNLKTFTRFKIKIG